jgi:hypothetical protein
MSATRNTGKTDNTSWAFGINQSGSGFNLSDYASIKNGSYGKLLKAYYAKDSSGASKSNEAVNKIAGNSRDLATTNTSLSKDTAALSKSADALLKQGEGSLFEEKDLVTKDENGAETRTKGYDREGIYKAVSAFAKDYNSLIDSASKSNNTSVLSTAANMTSQTAVYRKALEKIGVKIGDDNTLSIDKETFDKTDVSSIKSLFNGSGSFADMTKSRSDIIETSARTDALKGSGTYGSTGLYDNALLGGASFSNIV